MVDRIHALLDKFAAQDLDGTLRETARWNFSSQLIVLAKLGKEVPRPIRAGEYWRKVVAKVALKRHLPQIHIRAQTKTHTNIKEYVPETGFGVLPVVPGRRAAFHD